MSITASMLTDSEINRNKLSRRLGVVKPSCCWCGVTHPKSESCPRTGGSMSDEGTYDWREAGARFLTSAGMVEDGPSVSDIVANLASRSPLEWMEFGHATGWKHSDPRDGADVDWAEAIHDAHLRASELGTSSRWVTSVNFNSMQVYKNALAGPACGNARQLAEMGKKLIAEMPGARAGTSYDPVKELNTWTHMIKTLRQGAKKGIYPSRGDHPVRGFLTGMSSPGPGTGRAESAIKSALANGWWTEEELAALFESTWLDLPERIGLAHAARRNFVAGDWMAGVERGSPGHRGGLHYGSVNARYALGGFARRCIELCAHHPWAVEALFEYSTDSSLCDLLEGLSEARGQREMSDHSNFRLTGEAVRGRSWDVVKALLTCTAFASDTKRIACAGATPEPGPDLLDVIVGMPQSASMAGFAAQIRAALMECPRPRLRGQGHESLVSLGFSEEEAAWLVHASSW
jgi:hypothetical protein